MLQPVSDEDWPEELADLRDGFMGKANVYRVLAHHPALVRAWVSWREHIVNGSRLGPEASEVVILRLAHRTGTAYEWAHHVVRARDKGFSDDRIRQMRGDPAAMAAGDADIARAVDALHDQGALPGPLAERLGERFGKEGVLDLIATVGTYTLLGFVLNSFDTPVDPDIAGRLERRPLD